MSASNSVMPLNTVIISSPIAVEQPLRQQAHILLLELLNRP